MCPVFDLTFQMGQAEIYRANNKEFLTFLLKKRLYEFTPIEVSKMLGVTNKTIINRCPHRG